MEQTGKTSHNGHRSGNGRVSITDGAVRTVSGIADVTTSSIGALGGAAVGSVVGGVRGAVGGVADGTRRGLEVGSRSTPAAILTMAAAGAAGIVEWPVVLTVGGAALVLRQLHDRGATPEADAKPAKEEPTPRARRSGSSTAAKTKRKASAKSAVSRPRGRTAK
ncbi:hypothetical protein EGT50_08090 [Rhodococcus xishaensis]|uniref:Transmembrane protein n=1 Tax=Rhodococcus xishaensis TaxID=2487364 RepID=A0A438AVG0_9NOCA|nr:hypothetical protein EGT50_08090 [Rhodococcus xishaensis]